MTQSIGPNTTRASHLALTSTTPLYHLFQPHKVIDTILSHVNWIRGIPGRPIINLAQKLILVPKKVIESKIRCLHEPDPSLIEKINIHEETPGKLWCALLERAIQAPKLRKWLLGTIQVEWLSKEDAVGRACRVLLQSAFDESILRKWARTGPEPRILLNFFEDRSVRKQALTDDTLVHLKMLPLHLLALQSLTHFPWKRLQHQLRDTRPAWLTSLQKNILQLKTIPEGLQNLCRQTHSANEITALLEMIGQHPAESFLIETNALLQTLCKLPKRPDSEILLRSHINAIRKLKNPPAALLQGAINLLLNPVSKVLDQSREFLFDQIVKRSVSLYLNAEILGEGAQHLHSSLLKTTKETPLHLAGRVQTSLTIAPTYGLSARTIMEQAKAVVEHYLEIDPDYPLDEFRNEWDRVPLNLSATAIELPFDSQDHLPLMKIYLKRLCAAKHASTPLHWTFSLFAIAILHKFTVNHPREGAFSAEMIAEIFYNSYFPREEHHSIIAKAFFGFESEHRIKIPHLSSIKNIFLLAIDSLTPACVLMIPKVIYRLLDNGCLGALNEARILLENFSALIPKEKDALEQKRDGLLRTHLERAFEDSQYFADFADQYPQLMLQCGNRMLKLQGKNKQNALKGMLHFLIQDIRSNGDADICDALKYVALVRDGLVDFVKCEEFEEIRTELLLAIRAYSKKLMELMDVLYRLNEISHLQPLCLMLTDEVTNALATLDLHRIYPKYYKILWHKLLVFYLRQLMLGASSPSNLLRHYATSHPEGFSNENHLDLSVYANQIHSVADSVPQEVIEAHDAFFVRAGYYTPRFFDEIISTLDDPDNRLYDSIRKVEEVPAAFTLQLFKHVQLVKNASLDEWILRKVLLDWFLRGDEIGSNLRDLIKRAPQELHISMLNDLFAIKEPVLQVDHLHQLLSAERIYPNSLLNALKSILTRMNLDVMQKEPFLFIFLNQDLQFFPWEWATHKNILLRVSQQILKTGYLPHSLQLKLQSDLVFADALIPLMKGSPHPQHLHLFQPWISRTLNKKNKPDLLYIETLVHALLNASTSDWIPLQQAAALIFHPSLNKLPHLNGLYDRLIDKVLCVLFEGSTAFAQNAILFHDLADEFPKSKYGEDPKTTRGFAVRPAPTLSLRSIVSAANATLLHYLKIVLFFDEEKTEDMQCRLQSLEEEAPDEGIPLSFDGQFHWLLIEKLLRYPVKNDAERCLLTLFARVHLHQYAMNHRNEQKKLLTTNEEIFFLSNFQSQGAFYLQQFAYSMFADEKRFESNRERRVFNLDLIAKDVHTLRHHKLAHTKSLHDLFMGLIRAGTLSSLEIVERLRSELCFSFDPEFWAVEGAATVKTFVEKILPLLETSGNLSAIFQTRIYLLQFTLEQLEENPQLISGELCLKLLTMLTTPPFSDLRQEQLIAFWKIYPQIVTDERFILALLICAESVRQSIVECGLTGEIPRGLSALKLLEASPLHTVAPILYLQLWQNTHEWLLVKTLTNAEKRPSAWLTQLNRLMNINHRDLLLEGKHSLRPYLVDVLERIKNNPAFQTYEHKMVQFLQMD